MDQPTRDKIARDAAYHRAALARREEAFSQELDHRRLMLGLERFHEYEMTNIRKHHGAVAVSSRVSSKRGVEPKGTLFKQVAEDGSEIEEPLHLRVVWVDSDCGGLFTWTNPMTEGNRERNARDRNGTHTKCQAKEEEQTMS
ncbi:hypothetical protein ACLMJK_003977 [Lecanora helva]